MVYNHFMKETGAIIKKALLDEVYATPKPGLVDLHDNGAHNDMDVALFERSTEAIVPYLVRMFEAGKNGEPFSRVRLIGREAEREMFRATGGVNTHKGMIFSMGLLLTALGRIPEDVRDFRVVCRTAAELARPELSAELEDKTPDPERVQTHGEKAYVRYGVRGVRGEALAGFPVLVNIAIPRLKGARESGLDDNDCAVDTLVAVMAALDDTNVITRGGPEALQKLKSYAASILERETPGTDAWRSAITAFNRWCIKENISPGGAADTLALALFAERIVQ